MEVHARISRIRSRDCRKIPSRKTTTNAGLSSTGPKGVINDFRKYKQMKVEQKQEQKREMERLIKKLSMTCRSDLDLEKDEEKKKQLQEKIKDKVRTQQANTNVFARGQK